MSEDCTGPSHAAAIGRPMEELMQKLVSFGRAINTSDQVFRRRGGLLALDGKACG